MSTDFPRLNKLFRFLKENTKWNEGFQNFEYNRNLAGCATAKERLHHLLRGTAGTQSQPKMGSLGPFWRSLDAFEIKGVNTMAALTQYLVAQKAPKKPGASPWDQLYQALKEQPGWGRKTSALFVKNVIRIHRGPANLHFWADAELLARAPIEDDLVYLPVDRVIEELFRSMGMPTPNFGNINKLLHTHFSPEDMLVWDDLWFWGFFTQMVKADDAETGSTDTYLRGRTMEWNDDKYWCQIATPKGKKDIVEIKKLATRFIELFDTAA
jgi:hypothetical protein